MDNQTAWRETDLEIIRKIDIEAECLTFGIVFAPGSASTTGWKKCKALQREDRNPSAAVNIGDGVSRGRYKDHGGEGLSLGFFELAGRFGGYGDWKTARAHFAEKVGVMLPIADKAKKRAAKHKCVATVLPTLNVEAHKIESSIEGSIATPVDSSAAVRSQNEAILEVLAPTGNKQKLPKGDIECVMPALVNEAPASSRGLTEVMRQLHAEGKFLQRGRNRLGQAAPDAPQLDWRSKICAHLVISERILNAVWGAYYPSSTSSDQIRSDLQFPNFNINTQMAYCAVPVRNLEGGIVGILLIALTGACTEDVLIGESGIICCNNWGVDPYQIVVVRNAREALCLMSLGIPSIALADESSDPQLLVKVLDDCNDRCHRDHNIYHRGIVVSGPPEWAGRIAQILRDGGHDETWCANVPDGFLDFQALIAANLQGYETPARLLELGRTLSDHLYDIAVEPEAISLLPQKRISHAPLLPVFGKQLDALLNRTDYTPYLSPAAKSRGWTSSEEDDVAEVTAELAASERKDDVACLMDYAQIIGKAVDEEHSLDEIQQFPPREKLTTHESMIYQVLNRQICIQRLNLQGLFEYPPLCNFQAIIKAEVVVDDGAETTTFFQIEGTLFSGEVLTEIEVRADEFADMDWVIEKWGANAVVFVGRSNKDHVRAAIQLLSGNVCHQVVYGHTGWRLINKRWHYLHAGGAIASFGVADGISVRLPEPLKHFLLEPPCSKLRDPKMSNAVRSSLKMLDGLAPDRVIFPIYAAIWRAILGDTDLSIFLVGYTGVFKSELVALAQQHYGPAMNRMKLPGNWSSTANGLEGILHAAKDTLFVIDDFCPPASATESSRYHQKADQVLRGAGNGAGRLRMRADTTLRPEKPPRCLPCCTGEDSPRGQSLQARLMQTDITPGDVNIASLTTCQYDAASGSYALALAGYVRWLAPQFDCIRKSMQKDIADERKIASQVGQHQRTPTIVADLLVGLKWFLRFAYQVEAVSKEQSESIMNRCRTALGIAAVSQTADQGEEEPTGKFMRLIASVLASGRGHLADPDGQVPTADQSRDDNGNVVVVGAGTWGWRCKTVGTGQYEREEWQPQGPCIGWIDGDNLYLEPDAAFASVHSLGQESGNGMAIAPRTLWKRLRSKGLLLNAESERGNKVRKTLGGVSDRSVIHMQFSRLHKKPSENGISQIAQTLRELDEPSELMT